MFVRSERLFLRPAWPEDWNEVHPLLNDLSVVRNLSRVPWPYTPDDARLFAGVAQDRRYPHFLITLPGASGSRVIGSVGIAQGDEGPELGYWIARLQWGRHFATEAVRALLPLARAIGHTRLLSWVFADNPASARVLKNNGFAAVGPVRQRLSPGRRQSAPAERYVLDLPEAAGCGECGDSRMAA